MADKITHVHQPNQSSEAPEPIAIVGIGCRFPGGAHRPDTYWDLMCNGVDTITEIPPDRWDVDKFYDPTGSQPGTTHIRYGSFLSEIDRFDAHFFDVSPREAAVMDPQQRMMLELVWEAVEDAGQAPEKLAGTRTGVFMGVFALDQMTSTYSELDRELLGPHSGVGASMSIVANRISFWFDFKGPSLGLDTACSSSLVATHLGCHSLWSGETDYVVCGGVNAIFKPEWTIGVSRGGFLSVDGHCKSFDASANGYVRGEGAGAVLLKRLSDAVRDGDRIYSLIMGTGSNQDGHTPGITLPNGDSQKALMKEVYAKAGIPPSRIQYVEAHGTGTVAGDPVEADSIGTILREGRGDDSFCYMGSVKSNIGHLEAAAGVASLIKASLALYHGQIPGNIHLNELNPAIDLEGLKLRIPTSVVDYPGQPGSRFAGVNSFGFGGTNAHAILADPAQATHWVQPAAHALPSQADDATHQADQPSFLIPFSAKSPTALKEVVERHLNFLREHKPALSDFGSHLSLRKGRHRYRTCIVAQTAEDLDEKMTSFLEGTTRSEIVSGEVLESTDALVFVYSGMGPQWWAMGRELLEQQPVFREAVETCDAMLSKWADWSLLEILTASESDSRIDETRVAQPAIFAVQVGLTALWRAWGIEPTAIVGHSAGEVAAAWASGALSLEDACRVIFERSRLQHLTEGEGRMMAVSLSPEDVAPFIADHLDKVSIGAINSPHSVTLSGDESVLEAIGQQLDAQDVFRRLLYGKVPYHSQAMDRIKPELIASLSELKPQAVRVPLYSTVTGQRIEGTALGATYWADNCRETVHFSEVIEQLIQDGKVLYLEINAHPVLASSLKEGLAFQEAAGAVVGSIRRKQPEWEVLMSQLGLLDAHGYAVDWQRLYPGRAQFLELPRYPWQKERHWLNSEAVDRHRHGASGQTAMAGEEVHALLGSRYPMAQPLWESHLGLKRSAYLADHCVQGTPLFPGAGYVELALAMAHEMFGDPACRIEDFEFKSPMFLVEGQSVCAQSTFQPNSAAFAIAGRPSTQDANWVEHASGSLFQADDRPLRQADLSAFQGQCGQEVAFDTFYAAFARLGLEYGPQFQRLKQFYAGTQEGYGRIDGSKLEALGDGSLHLHPVILDAAFQAFLATVLFASEQPPRSLILPTGVDSMRFVKSPSDEVWVHVKCDTLPTDEQRLRSDIALYDRNGDLIADIRGFRCQFLEQNTEDATAFIEDRLHAFEWNPQSEELAEVATSNESGGGCVIFADRNGLGDALADALSAKGYPTFVIRKGAAYAEQSDQDYTVCNGNKEDLEKALQRIGSQNSNLNQLVYLWGLNPDSDDTLQVPDQARESLDLLNLVQSELLLQETSDPSRRLCVVTRHAQFVESEDPVHAVGQAALWGLGRVIMNERPDLGCQLIDLGTPSESDSETLLREILSTDKEDEVAWRNGCRHVHRLNRLPASEISGVQNLSSDADPLDERVDLTSDRQEPAEGEVELEITRFTACDGWPSSPDGLMACEGRVVRTGPGSDRWRDGDRVVSLVPQVRRYLTLPERQMAAQPSGSDDTTPLALTASHVAASHLMHLFGPLDEASTVLVHDAASSVGWALVTWLRASGVKVIATCSDPHTSQALSEQEGVRVVDPFQFSFRDEVFAFIGPEGLDGVVITTDSPALPSLEGCLASDVRYTVMDASWTAPKNLPGNACVSRVDLAALVRGKPNTVEPTLQRLFDRHQQEALPLPNADRVRLSDLDRSVSGAAAIQRIQVVEGWETSDADTSSDEPDDAFKPTGTWMITGGLSGFGFAAAEWLYREGVRHFVLLSRSGRPDEKTQASIDDMIRNGAEVLLRAVDVTDFQRLNQVFTDVAASDLPPLKGVIHSANLYADAPLMEMQQEAFLKVVDTKVEGAWNLHLASRPMDLDYFILFSSISSWVGNPGQANYCAGNAFLDSLSAYRRQQGLPSLTLNWGALAEVGFLASHQEVNDHLQRIGIQSMDPRRALESLPMLNGFQQMNLCMAEVDWPTWASFHETGASPKFSKLVQTSNASEGSGKPPLIEELEQLEDPQARQLRLREQILEVVAGVLGVGSTDQIDLHRGLTEMGMDSMLAMELRQRLQEAYACKLQATAMFMYPNVEKLVGLFRDQLLQGMFDSQEVVQELGEEDLDDMSEEDLEGALARELAELRESEQ